MVKPPFRGGPSAFVTELFPADSSRQPQTFLGKNSEGSPTSELTFAKASVSEAQK
jgi:hypothetical protein